MVHKQLKEEWDEERQRAKIGFVGRVGRAEQHSTTTTSGALALSATTLAVGANRTREWASEPASAPILIISARWAQSFNGHILAHSLNLS